MSAGWQVTLCDPIWALSSSSGVATSVSEVERTAISVLLYLWNLYFLLHTNVAWTLDTLLVNIVTKIGYCASPRCSPLHHHSAVFVAAVVAAAAPVVALSFHHLC